MIFGNLQSTIAGLIAADSTLAALGTPIQANPLQEREAAKSAIDTQLRTTGVCIEVSVDLLRNVETLLNGDTKCDIVSFVFVEEHVKHTHTPHLGALVLKIVQVVTKPQATGQKPIRLESNGVEMLPTDTGSLIWRIPFFVPTNIKQP